MGEFRRGIKASKNVGVSSKIVSEDWSALLENPPREIQREMWN